MHEMTDKRIIFSHGDIIWEILSICQYLRFFGLVFFGLVPISSIKISGV